MSRTANFWVPVSYCLPEIHRRVLVWFKDNTADDGFTVKFAERTFDGHWRPEGGNGNFDDFVSYWMPLPDKPGGSL